MNRYRDVLPCMLSFTVKQINSDFVYEYSRFRLLDDDTRVRLTDGHNDYINANLIEVPWANRKYILTQVIKDFLQMKINRLKSLTN